eukprot:TRINITY_DN8425_c0_g1_i2.p1 TRINITY_DN8425_c0_g1~~TRINITY_DN8425_c0_g1_i2.p1  ORF type:complete len:418 (+),score=54.12 TRINITY_DN8425_c0_g1_i2:77-1330(+)
MRSTPGRMGRLFLFLVICFATTVAFDTYENVELDIRPCEQDDEYVADLTHSNFVLRWLDNHPSMVMYPILDGVIVFEHCLILEFNGWKEKGALNESHTCNFTAMEYGLFSWDCFDVLTQYQDLKNLAWSYDTDNHSKITWTAPFQHGNGSFEIEYEIINETVTKSFENVYGTDSRILQFGKDSIEFTVKLHNYTMMYESPEKLLGDLYELEISVGWVTSGKLVVIDSPALGPARIMAADRVVDAYLNNITLVPYELDDPNITCYIEKEDGSFNASLTFATFTKSWPVTNSVLLAKDENNAGLTGFDVYSYASREFYTFNETVVGQKFDLGFAMFKDKPQYIYFDPNIQLSVLLQEDSGSDGESDSRHDFIVALTVGVAGGVFVIVVIVAIISILVLYLKKENQKHKLARSSGRHGLA